MELMRRDSDYAVRAVAALARQEPRVLVSAAAIARAERLAEPLLRKLLQKLSRAGIVESVMGKDGGFRLTRDPGRLSLLEVVEAIQGRVAVNLCFSRPDRCSDQKTCAVRNELTDVQAKLRTSLKDITIADVVRNGRSPQRNRQKAGPKAQPQEV